MVIKSALGQGAVAASARLVYRGAAPQGQHQVPIGIPGEFPEAGGVPVADEIHPRDQAAVVVAALGRLGRLRMVVHGVDTAATAAGRYPRLSPG